MVYFLVFLDFLGFDDFFAGGGGGVSAFGSGLVSGAGFGIWKG